MPADKPSLTGDELLQAVARDDKIVTLLGELVQLVDHHADELSELRGAVLREGIQREQLEIRLLSGVVREQGLGLVPAAGDDDDQAGDTYDQPAAVLPLIAGYSLHAKVIASPGGATTNTFTTSTDDAAAGELPLIYDDARIGELRAGLEQLLGELHDEANVPERFESTAHGLLAESDHATLVRASSVLYRLCLWQRFPTISPESYVARRDEQNEGGGSVA